MDKEKYIEHYNEVYKQDFKPKENESSGWIQWKGTNVCMDLHCKCGYCGHIDDDFFYFYECPNCHTKYAVGQTVKLIELNEQQQKWAENGVGFKTDNG